MTGEGTAARKGAVNGVADTWLIRGPFAGVALPGRVAATFLRGAPAVLDGKLAS